jgi:hypothetical protein
MSQRFKVPAIIIAVLLATFIMWWAAHSAHRVKVKRYAIIGTVVAVHSENGTARVHNEDIPGFMQTMEMDYKIANPRALSSLKSGDSIRATLVSDGQNTWALENISVVAATNTP